MKASAANGPYSVYFEDMGYTASDMSYNGNPIHFDTRVSVRGGFSEIINILGFDVVLKSFSYSRSTVSEVVNYTFEGGEDIQVMSGNTGGAEEC